MTDRLLALRDVTARVALGRTALYDRVRRGEFPAPVKLSATRNAWLESEVQEWIDRLVSGRAAARSDAPAALRCDGGEARAAIAVFPNREQKDARSQAVGVARE